MAAARRALELNPQSAEAHTSLAAATAFYTCDAESAFGDFEQAIALDPDYASAWHFYGVVLFGRKLYDRALQALQRAQSLDPLSPIFGVQIASLHYLRREFRKAASLCDDLIRLDPEFWPARWFGGMALEQQAEPKKPYVISRWPSADRAAPTGRLPPSAIWRHRRAAKIRQFPLPPNSSDDAKPVIARRRP